VTHDETGDERNRRPPTNTRSRLDAQDQAPHDQKEQRVRVRVRHEVERREGRIAGIDADLLDSERDENGPHHIRELRWRISTASDARGASRLAARATPKCPMTSRHRFA
jgi:hypothetical protein